MLDKIHFWLIRFVVGKRPVIMNFHFVNGITIHRDVRNAIIADNIFAGE